MPSSVTFPFPVPKENLRIRLRTLARNISRKFKTELRFVHLKGAHGDTDGSLIRIDPANPYELSKAIWLVSLQHTTCHEAWHVLWSDFAAWEEYLQEYPIQLQELASDIGNILEDGRIEYYGANTWEGAYDWIRTARWAEYKYNIPFFREPKVSPLSLAISHFHSRTTMGIRRPGIIDEREKQCIKECLPHIETAIHAHTTIAGLVQARKVVDIFKKYYEDDLPKVIEIPEGLFSDIPKDSAGEMTPDIGEGRTVWFVVKKKAKSSDDDSESEEGSSSAGGSSTDSKESDTSSGDESSDGESSSEADRSPSRSGKSSSSGESGEEGTDKKGSESTGSGAGKEKKSTDDTDSSPTPSKDSETSTDEGKESGSKSSPSDPKGDENGSGSGKSGSKSDGDSSEDKPGGDKDSSDSADSSDGESSSKDSSESGDDESDTDESESKSSSSADGTGASGGTRAGDKKPADPSGAKGSDDTSVPDVEPDDVSDEEFSGELAEDEIDELVDALKDVLEDEASEFFASLPDDPVEVDYNSEIEKSIRKISIHRNFRLDTVVPASRADIVHQILHDRRNDLMQMTAKLSPVLLPKKEDQFRQRKHGSLDPGNLWRLPALKETRVFQKVNAPSRKKDVAITILVDESGSMGCVAGGMERTSRSQAARSTAVITAKALVDLQCSVRVIGFEEPNDSTVRHRVYKEWHESSLDRLGSIHHYSNNRDGYSIRAVGADLAKRPEPIKILMVISDGDPLAVSYSGSPAIIDTKNAVDELRRKKLVVMGFFVGDIDPGSVAVEKTIFGNEVVLCHDMSMLGVHMSRLLKRKLQYLM